MTEQQRGATIHFATGRDGSLPVSAEDAERVQDALHDPAALAVEVRHAGNRTRVVVRVAAVSYVEFGGAPREVNLDPTAYKTAGR